MQPSSLSFPSGLLEMFGRILEVQWIQYHAVNILWRNINWLCVCKSINLEREPVERSLIFTWNCWGFFYSVTLGLLSEIRDHEMLVCWPRLSPWRLCKSPRVDKSPAVWNFLLALFSITSDSKDKVYGQKHWLDVTWWPRGCGCNKYVLIVQVFGVF